MRGIYVDAAEDIDQTVLAHAVRIGRYLYPNAYLSAASAVLLGPTRDGRLYLTGPRVQRTRIRYRRRSGQDAGCRRLDHVAHASRLRAVR